MRAYGPGRSRALSPCSTWRITTCDTACEADSDPLKSNARSHTRGVCQRRSRYLAAGDSFGDMEMMDLAVNRLVVARLNNPKLTAGYAEGVDAAPDATWMVQPVISTVPVGLSRRSAP